MTQPCQFCGRMMREIRQFDEPAPTSHLQYLQGKKLKDSRS
ncbi:MULTISPECIES: hypothetical protein [Photobacterium]|nr:MULTISPECIES: hypothetical protein [Photobacterium]